MSLVLLLARVLKRSVSGARMPSIVPNMVLSPKLSSMRKKSADQKGLPGSSDMASVKAIKAKPVPSTPCTTKRASVLSFNGELAQYKSVKRKDMLYLLHLFFQVAFCYITRETVAILIEPGIVVFYSNRTGI